MKLLITGGHVTPALACIDKLKQENIDVDVLFVGRKYGQTGDTQHSYEYQEITKRNIPFSNLTAGRLTRVLNLQSIINVLKFPVGLYNAWQILRKEKPDKVLSFGGYLALPITLVAAVMGIPVYTHEQTIYPGLANRIIAKVAKKIFVSFPETKQYFPSSKTVVTGNPVRDDIFKVGKKPFEMSKSLPVIYITGGSLGAHSINIHIEAILSELVKKHIVIHQIGNVKVYDGYKRLKKMAGKNYYPVTHVHSDELGYIFSVADMVISRSGANTFFELAALQKPTIFIPLPWSANGEQQKHAEILKKHGVGEIFDQADESTLLLHMVEEMMTNLKTYKENFKQFPQVYFQNAAQTIISEILRH